MTEVRITDPKTGGQKGQKPERYDLLPFDALDEVARVYGVGATKYEDDNWLRGYSWRLSAGALLRHVAKWMVGIDRDEETGCHHLAHAAWHCLTLLTFTKRGLGTDDRAKEKKDEAPATDVAWTPKVGDMVQIVTRDKCNGDTGVVARVDLHGYQYQVDTSSGRLPFAPGELVRLSPK